MSAVVLPILLYLLACRSPGTVPGPDGSKDREDSAPDSGATETGSGSGSTAATGHTGQAILTLADADIIYRATPSTDDEDAGLGWAAAAVDVDLDGSLELVLASGLHGYVFELDERRGELTSEDAAAVVHGGGGWSFATGDMNGDGFEDTMSFRFTYEEVYFAPQPGTETARLWVNGYALSAPKPMDVDGDGQLDLVHAGNGSIQVHYGPFDPGEERWPDVQLVYDGPEVFALHSIHPSVDLTGDGQPDLLARGDFRLHVIPLPIPRDAVGSTQGVFRLVEESSDVLTVGLASVDETGKPGLLLGGKDPQDPDNRDRSGHHLAELPVHDWNWTSQALFHSGRTETSFVRYPRACDVDSDGITDLAVIYWAYDGTYSANLLLGPFEGDVDVDADADFRIDLTGMDPPPDSVVPMDLNDNGDLDLLVLERGNNYLFLDVGIGPVGLCNYPGSSMHQ